MKSPLLGVHCVLALAAPADAAATAKPSTYSLSMTPASPVSIAHGPQFLSYSFEPAFWTEFFGEPDAPRNLTFALLEHLHERGMRSIIRPGGISMDSMAYDGSQTASVVRTENSQGGIYRTTVGPAFYRSWDNFPEGTRFVSTLNFGNASIPIDQGLAAASYRLQRDKIALFELGNEPNNYPSSRWHGSTAAYIAQWQNFTAAVDAALGGASHGRWWASSATTDDTSLKIRPSDLIPAGVDSTGEVAQYCMHTYQFATCDPARTALATIAGILNHTSLAQFADAELGPSARAAQQAGSSWAVGEYNSIACSGKANVSDTFAQALWTADSELLLAVRNASSAHLHQGATLVFQSSAQLNKPGFARYNLLYPVDSDSRGPARVLPVFVSQLLLAEALANSDASGGGGARVAALATPQRLSGDSFSAYAIFSSSSSSQAKNEEKKSGVPTPDKLVLLNMRPYYAGQKAAPTTLSLGLGQHKGAVVKRMTAPSVDELDAAKVTWAGQSFRDGVAVGDVAVERLGAGEKVLLRDSEAVLVTFE